MRLPEPASTVWNAHRGAIERIAAAPGGESRILLGGGTILAARWGHRNSTDIDILLPERHTLNDAEPGGAVDLGAATGGGRLQVLARQIRVTVGEGRIDVAAITPELPGLEICNDEMARGASRTLLAVPAEYRDLAGQPGEAASDAMRGCRYTDATIQMCDGRIEVVTRTTRGTTRVERYDPEDAAAALRESGMREYLENNTQTLPVAIEKAIETLRREKRNGTAFTSTTRSSER